jgi:hypothetical protein
MEDNKLIKLKEYSDPQKVIQNIKTYLGNDIKLFISSHKDKKYMLQHPETNKFIHFGAMNMTDFTRHQDKKRQENFKKRNAKWSQQDQYTPGWLSYHLLW